MRKLGLSLALAAPLAVTAIPSVANAAPTSLTPATVASKPAVAPAACSPSGRVTIRGAEASWSKCTAPGGQTRVIGWVADTAADGRCARVRAVWSGGAVEETLNTCPKGMRRDYNWVHPGTADVRLFTVPA